MSPLEALGITALLVILIGFPALWIVTGWRWVFVTSMIVLGAGIAVALVGFFWTLWSLVAW